MQNSIWKLTGLAGVIGIGFLIVLQAQNGLDQTGRPQANSLEAPPTAPGTQETIDQSATSLWQNPGQAEPEILSQMDGAEPAAPAGLFESPGFSSEPVEPPLEREPASTDLFGQPLAQNQLPELQEPRSRPVRPTSLFGDEPFVADGSSNGPLPELPELNEPAMLAEPAAMTETLDGGLLLTSSELEPPLTGLPATDAALPELPLGSELTTNADPILSNVGSVEDPFAPVPTISESPALPAIPGLPSESDRSKAQRLMREARALFKDDDLMFAREKAVEAGELPVDFGLGDDDPAVLIAEIDRLLDETPASEPVAELPAGPALEDPFAPLNEPLPVLDGPAPKRDAAPSLLTGLTPATEPALKNAVTPATAALLTGLDPFESAPALEPQPALESQPAPNDPPKQFVAKSVSEVASVVAAPQPGAGSELKGDAEIPTDAPGAMLRPELTIEKTAPPEASLGKPMIYSILVSNRGEANATQVVVEDRIPKGCTLVGTIPQAELIGTKLQWRLGRLASNDKRRIQVKVIPTEIGEIGSVATVNFVAEVSASTDVKPDRIPQLSLSMSGPDRADVGEVVVISFRIENQSEEVARKVTLQEIVPAGFEHPAGSDLTFEVGDIAPGQKFETELELKAIRPGEQANRVVITAAGGIRAESTAKIQVDEISGLKLEVLPTAAKPVGQKVALQLRVTNPASAAVDNAAVSLVLPAELRFAAASDNGTFDKSTQTVLWKTGVVPPGKSVTLTATVIPTNSGVHASRAQLAQPGQSTVEAEALVEAQGFAALKLDLENVPPTVAVGEEFTVTVTIKNRGNGPDSNVQLALLLPAGTSLVDARGPVRHGQPQLSNSASRVPFAAMPEFGEQASVDFEITLKSQTAGRPKLRAEVRSDQLAEPVATEAAVVVIDAP